jgi:hypothetical protein
MSMARRALQELLDELKRRDGGTLEYVFDSDARSVLQTVTKEKVAEIAADFMTTYYGVQVGALETQELRQQPIPFWLVCFLGHRQRIFTAIVLCHCLAGWDDR